MAVADARARAVAPPPVRRLFRRTAVPVWALLAALTAVSLAGVALPRWARLAPLAASVVLLGLPHGAIDPFVPARAGDVGVRRALAVVSAVYLVLGGAYAALWLAAPAAAALSFVALTWFHWGQGDLAPLLALGGDHLDSRPRRALTLVVRGGLPMAVPLVAFPDQYRAVVAAWVGLFGSTLRAGWLFEPGTRLALGAGLGLATVLTLSWGYRAGGGTAWAVDAAETGLLWAFFLSVPPLLAVGVYFCLWHSLRHVLRVLALDETAVTALGRGDARGALGRFAREAAPLTALALAAFGGLWLLAPGASLAPADLLAVYLVLLAVLTLPHTAVVTWLDCRQGIWEP